MVEGVRRRMNVMRYFITGATGLLGLALVQELQKRGEKDITAFVMPNDGFAKYLPKEVKVVTGDILDKDSLMSSIQTSDIVIHLAAFISISGDREKMRLVNYVGTKNVVDVALEKKVRKFIYVSTSHVLPSFEGKKIVESDYGKEGSHPIGYYESTKKMATDYVFLASSKGLNATVLYPSGILSANDPRCGEMTTLLYKLKKRKLTYIVKGGYAFVDVDDVVKAIIQAIEKGKSGEGYTISGGYLSIKDIDDILVSYCPTIKRARLIPTWSAYLGLPFIAIHERLSKKKPLYTFVSLRTLRAPSDFDTSKAKNELGITFTPLEDTIIRIIKSIQ